MKILIIDETTLGQALYFSKLEEIRELNHSYADCDIQLCEPDNYFEKIDEVDIVLLGSCLGDDARSISTRIKALKPEMQIIMFVPDYQYSAGAFQVGYSCGARKVLSDNCNTIDLLQELIASSVELHKIGKKSECKVIVGLSPTGGLGLTSFIAAAGDLLSTYGKRVLIWDLDIQSKDLSRALMAPQGLSVHIDRWLENRSSFTKASFQEALFPLAENASLLLPPATMGSGMEFISRANGIELAEDIINHARNHYDVILIDAGGLIGTAQGMLLRMASEVLMIVGKCPLTVSATDSFLTFTERLLRGNPNLKFLPTSAAYDCAYLREQFDPEGDIYSESAWQLPHLPFDSLASGWAGKGKTLYSLGNDDVRYALETICRSLQLLDTRARVGAEDVMSNRILSQNLLDRSLRKMARRVRETVSVFVPTRYRTIEIREEDIKTTKILLKKRAEEDKLMSESSRVLSADIKNETLAYSKKPESSAKTYSIFEAKRERTGKIKAAS